MRHRGAGRLLAVAHGGVEDDDAVALATAAGIRAVMEVSSRRGVCVGRRVRSPGRPAAKMRGLEGRPGAAKPQRKKKQAVQFAVMAARSSAIPAHEATLCAQRAARNRKLAAKCLGRSRLAASSPPALLRSRAFRQRRAAQPAPIQSAAARARMTKCCRPARASPATTAAPAKAVRAIFGTMPRPGAGGEGAEPASASRRRPC